MDKLPKYEKRTKSKQLEKGQANDLFQWIRPLQQALTLEAENGFQNMLGRDEYFDSFLTRQLALPPKEYLQIEKLNIFRKTQYIPSP